MDGSTDTGNVEDEVIVILYSARDEATEEIRSCLMADQKFVWPDIFSGHL